QLRNHAHVHHILDQFAQLGLRADGRSDLVERHRIADHVVAILLEVQVFFVNGHATRGQRQNVFLGSLRVERDQYFGVALPGDVTVLAGADGVPGRQAGDVGREEVFAADRHTHAEDALQQDAVCRLRTGTVDSGYIDAEVVHDALARTQSALFLTQGKVSSRHLAGFPSE